MKYKLLLLSLGTSLLYSCGTSNVKMNTICDINSKYYYATSKSNLDKMVKYSVNKDYTALDLMLANGTAAKFKYGAKGRVQSTSLGQVEIKLETSQQVVWTVIEAVDCK